MEALALLDKSPWIHRKIRLYELCTQVLKDSGFCYEIFDINKQLNVWL